MPTPFRTTRRIDFVDTDVAGIVHFSNFFRFMESAETEFLRSLGMSVKMGWEGTMLGFPRVSAACDYKSPAFFEDIVEIAVTILKIGTKSITYAFEFSRDGVFLAKGQVTSVCCREGPGQQLEAVAIPDSLRAKLMQASASPSPKK
jgi:acyl-CoA thioester hydrolase